MKEDKIVQTTRPYYETNSTEKRETFDYWTVDDGLVNQWEFFD